MPSQRTLILGAAITMISAVILYFFGCVTPNMAPTGAAKRFLAVAREDDGVATYRMTASQFQSSVPEDDFIEFLEKYPIITQQQRVSLQGHRKDKNIAEVQGTISNGTVIEFPIVMTMVKEGQTWKVLNINLNPKKE